MVFDDIRPEHTPGVAAAASLEGPRSRGALGPWRLGCEASSPAGRDLPLLEFSWD